MASKYTDISEVHLLFFMKKSHIRNKVIDFA